MSGSAWYSDSVYNRTLPDAYVASAVLGSGTLAIGASSTGAPGSVISGPIGTGGLLICQAGPASIAPTLVTTGNFTLANPVYFSGAWGATAGTVTLGDGTNPLTLSGPATLVGFATSGTDTITNGIAMTMITPSTVTISGNIGEDYPYAGSSLIKEGSGTLFLSGTNSYTSGTTVNHGTLEAVKPASLPNYTAFGQISRGPRGNARRVHRQLDLRQHRRSPTQLGLRQRQPGHRRSQRNVYL